MKHDKHCVFFTLRSQSGGIYAFSYMGNNIYEALGVSSDDVLEDFNVFFNLIKEEDRALFLDKIADSRQNQAPVNFIFRLNVNDRIYYAETRMSLKSYGDNSVLWDGVFVDISEQKYYVPEFSRHLDFEILISRISTKFIGLRIDEIDNGIEEALASIGTFSDTDRALVYIFQDASSTVEKIYEWCATGLPALSGTSENLSFEEELKGFYKALGKGDVVYIPDEGAHFKSLLIIPMMLNDKLFGFLSLVSLRKIQRWSLNDQILLRMCCEIFVNALNRKREEKRFSLTSILFEEIMKQSPIPMAVASPDGKLMIYNVACAEQLGVSFEDYVDREVNFFDMNKPWVDYDLTGKVIPQSELPLAKALQGLPSQPVEVMIVREDGSRRWHIVTGNPIFDKDGTLIAAFTAFPDFTKLKQAESSLLDRINELDCLYGIYHVVEHEGISIEEIVQSTVNLMAKYWKFPELISVSIEYDGKRYTSPFSVLQCDDPSRDIVKSEIGVYGKTTGFVQVCHCKDIPLPADDSFLNEENNLLNVIARRLGRIIEKKQSEEALARSEARLRNYLESAPDGIFVANGKGRYIEVNKAACKITGYEREELVGMKIASIMYKDDVEAAMENFRVCGIEGRNSGEFRYVSKSGKIKTWSVDSVKLSEDRFLGFAKDITENKRILEQLRQMEKMDAIGQLAGGIAHDFNNQIAVIMGYSEMLLSKLTDPKLKHFAENILASSHRSDDLTRKLLAFAHKGLYENTPVNIHNLIGEAVDILSHSIDKRISIDLSLRANPSFIKGDPTQIQNILLNLSLNARDAMPEGGLLHFETSNEVLDENYCAITPYEVSPGSFIKIIVSDDGAGIDAKDINRIFEPFFTTKVLGKGTGMGLASVFGAVTNHNGVIEVKSEPGEGTAFHLYFPQVENREISKIDIGTLRVSGRNATILLVDDDELIRQLGQDLLWSLGYTVQTCKDGIEAIELFKDNWRHIDLVILDMIMPGLGGKDVFRKLKEINSDVPVILSSGFSMSGDIQQLLDEGASAFIGKPFETGQFSGVLERALEGE